MTCGAPVKFDPKWSYPAEKFFAARRMLMLPHSEGEAESLKYAFAEIDHGLRRIPRDDLDADARAWVATIEEAMDTAGIEDPDGLGTWYLKAGRLSHDQKRQFSNAVDELANWFRRHLDGAED
jgi:hypothetical protein